MYCTNLHKRVGFNIECGRGVKLGNSEYTLSLNISYLFMFRNVYGTATCTSIYCIVWREKKQYKTKQNKTKQEITKLLWITNVFSINVTGHLVKGFASKVRIERYIDNIWFSAPIQTAQRMINLLFSVVKIGPTVYGYERRLKDFLNVEWERNTVLTIL